MRQSPSQNFTLLFVQRQKQCVELTKTASNAIKYFLLSIDGLLVNFSKSTITRRLLVEANLIDNFDNFDKRILEVYLNLFKSSIIVFDVEATSFVNL